jgi:hypothetical protein
MHMEDSRERATDVLILTPLDGAESLDPRLTPELEAVRLIASDPTRGLPEKLRAEPLPGDRYVAVLTGRRS